MTTYSSILAWKISWTEEPEGLQSIGLQRENSIETCISPYAKQMTSASLMYEAGHSKTVLWDNPEGCGGEEGGEGGSGWGDTCTHG